MSELVIGLIDPSQSETQHLYELWKKQNGGRCLGFRPVGVHISNKFKLLHLVRYRRGEAIPKLVTQAELTGDNVGKSDAVRVSIQLARALGYFQLYGPKS